MRKIIVFENITLDGFMSGLKGETDWAIRDKEVTQLATTGKNSVDMFLFGRVTYDLMAGFWPTAAGKAANQIFADLLNNTPKIVFSKTLKTANWENTKVINEISKEEVRKMKQSEGYDMMIFGSGTIVGELTNLGLVDEYQLMVNPVILGKGIPLFKDVKKKINLKLVKTKIFKNGIVLNYYQPEK
jgi:dihydrofolate reductase